MPGKSLLANYKQRTERANSNNEEVSEIPIIPSSSCGEINVLLDRQMVLVYLNVVM